MPIRFLNNVDLPVTSSILKTDSNGLVVAAVAGTDYLTSITSAMVTTALGYTPVPTTRTLTINGTALDLSANRSWTITTITGNAGSATVLQTARTLTIGNTGKTFNGSTNVSWTLAEIGAYAATNPSGFITSSGSITGTSGALLREDNRVISPSELTAGWLKFGFTSWANNNTSPYADFLHMRSYTDSSGGNDNLVMFLKSGIGMRIYQQAWGSTTAYSTFKDVAFTDSSITGNAATATVLATARTLTIGNTGKTFNGSADVSWTLAEIGAYAATNPSGFTSNTGTVTSVAGAGGYGGLTLSGTVITSGSITLGGTPTGTWPISVSGNAATATTATTTTGNAGSATVLQTARTINGTSFNGSANITTANWGTARTVTIGNTGKSVNGSANVSWSLAEIGAQAALTNPVTGTGTTNYLPKFTGGTTIGNSQVFDNGTNVGIGTASPTQKLEVNGSVLATSLIKSGGTSSQYLMADGSVSTTSNVAPRYVQIVNVSQTGYTQICTVSGNSLASAVNMSFQGTSNNVVVNVTAQILVNHFQDISIATTSGFYSQLNIRVISNNNETYSVEAQVISAVGATTDLNVEVFPLNSESVTFGGSPVTPGTSLVHTTRQGYYLSASEPMSISSGSDIYAAGNVGIGTTSPGYKLTLAAAAAADSDILLAGMTGVSNGFTVRRVSSSFVYSMIDGNLGVGTSSPNSRIEIAGTTGSYNSGIGFVPSGTGARNYRTYIASDGSFNFDDATAGATRINISSGGNVGIGTTSPTHKLHVLNAGSAAIIGDGNDNYFGNYSSGDYWDIGNLGSTGNVYLESRGASTNINGHYRLKGAGSHIWSYNGGSNEVMRTTSAGNVGIGTTSPSEKLHVVGNGLFTGGVYVNNTSAFLWNATNGVIRFGTNNTERARLDATGNLGIGTTSPTNRLTVTTATNDVDVLRLNNTGGDSGSVQGVTHLAINHFNSGTNPSTRITAYQDSVSGWPGGMYFSTRSVNTDSAPVERMRITSTGNVGIGTSSPNALYRTTITTGAGQTGALQTTGSVNINSGALAVGSITPSATAGRIDASNDIVAFSTSDKRLKENVTPIANALDKVKALTGVEFDWKEETKEVHGHEGHDVGVIAQEVQAVLPEAVRTNDSGYLSVRYEKMIALLIESNKELASRVEELEKKLK